MTKSRFEQMGFKPVIVPLTMSAFNTDYIAKLTKVSLTFQYFSEKFLKGRIPKNQSFYDEITKTKKYCQMLGIPMKEASDYASVSSRTLQRIFACDKIDVKFLDSIIESENFQKLYTEAYDYYFWKNPDKLKKIENRFNKNVVNLASFFD